MHERRFIICAMALLLLYRADPAGAQEPLTLKQAIALALERHPRIAAAQQELEAESAAYQGARSLSNPELLITPGFPRDATGSDEEILFVQPLEVNGSRRARTKLAQSAIAGGSAALDAVRNDLALQVKLAYWEAARAQAVAQLQRDIVSLGESLLQATKRQVEVGSAAGSQIIKAEVELGRAKQELIHAEADVKHALAVLGAVLGSSPERGFLLVDQLVFRRISYDAGELVENALARRAEIAEARAAIQKLRAEASVVRASGRPDLAIQIRNETFNTEAGIGIGISLPVFDWGSRKAAIRRAAAAIAAGERRLESASRSIRLDVETALIAIEAAEADVREFQSGILEKSEQLVKLAEKGYMAGATGYLEVLEAQRTFRDVRMRYVKALADYAKAVAQLEWATASDIPQEEESR